jgi:hypothetical protein
MKMSMPAQYTSESMPVSTVIWADTTLYVVFGLAEVVSNRRISWVAGSLLLDRLLSDLSRSELRGESVEDHVGGFLLHPHFLHIICLYI